MKTYTKLQLPKDTAWDRKTWRTYTHWRIKYFIDGVSNIIRWIPTLYRDRDWDDSFILKMLQKKIEYQRAYLVESNRHTRVDEDNYWMTVVLNLIEREQDEYYALEKYDYMEIEYDFIPVSDKPDCKQWRSTTLSEKLDRYLAKYPAAVRRVRKLHRDKNLADKETLALLVGLHNQERCRTLLFNILNNYSKRWWD